MRILHTSDWHLGLRLMGRSREDEQRAAVASLTRAVCERGVDLVLLAGDVYDSKNPPVWAVELFCSALRDFYNAGALTVVIAGNHDSPDGLSSVSPLALEHGAYIVGSPNGFSHTFGRGFVSHANGALRLSVKKAGQDAVIAALPYVSEARAAQIFDCDSSYADAVSRCFDDAAKEFRPDAVNLAVAHLFTAGGVAAGDERAIEGIGGSALFPVDRLPETARYVALGHLHRPQQVARNAFYSGSLLHNRFGEGVHDKVAMLVDTDGDDTQIVPIPISGGKKLVRRTFATADEAIAYCEGDADADDWLELRVDVPDVTHIEVQAMRERRPLLIRIEPFGARSKDASETVEALRHASAQELFTRLYEKQYGKAPDEELLRLFASLFENVEETP